jgi:hypothetical protein
MIIIGSKAMLSQLPTTYHEDKHRYNSRDYDVIMSLDEFKKWQEINSYYIQTLYPTESNKYKVSVYKQGVTRQYEIEIGFPGTSAGLLHQNKQVVTNGTVQGFFGETYHTISLSYLLLTKRSHLIYPVHFEKNVNDYHLLKNYLGEFTRDELMNTYYELRSKEAEERYKRRFL